MTEYNIYINFEPLVNALGANTISELPILDIGEKVGHSGYIDFILVNQMSDSIMKGIDCYKRPFIAFKFWIRSNDNIKPPYEAVGTFFQRYSDNNNSWAYGTCYELNSLYNDSRIRLCDYENLAERIKRLVNGEELPDLKYEPSNTIYIETVNDAGLK
jgi:hypothetical protein